MLTNSNPSNPDTPGGMPAPGAPADPAQLQEQQPQDPKTIRDYLSLARSQGQVPRFTNIDNAQGFDIRQDPGYIQNQAISEGPDNEYEAEPWDQRVLKDPYLRTTQSLPRFLDELWLQKFGENGPQQGTLDPDSPEAKDWGKQVEAVTSHLLKKYSKQHDWAMKNIQKNKAQRSKDEQYWQKFFATQNAKQQPVLNEDGSRMTEVEFIDKQMGIADERKMKTELGSEEEKENAEAEGTVGGTVQSLNDMKDKDIQNAIQRSPELAEKIKAQVIEGMSAIVGEQITEADFFAFRNDPRWQEQFRAEIKRIIDMFEEDIVTVANGGTLTAEPVQAEPGNAPQILSGDQPGFAGSQSGMSVPGGMS
jgi:hypothetical protein